MQRYDKIRGNLYRLKLQQDHSIAERLHSDAMHAEMTGNTRQAVRLLKQVLKTVPDSADTHNNLGAMYLQLGRVNLAEQKFFEALRLDPYHAAAHNNLGICKRWSNPPQFNDAVVHFLQALKYNPTYPEALLNLAKTYFQINEYNFALRYFRQYLMHADREDTRGIKLAEQMVRHLDTHVIKLVSLSNRCQDLPRRITRRRPKLILHKSAGSI